MTRRGFTLLELMVVLAILLALASVAVPALLTSSRASRLPEAQGQIEAAMMMARADAQRQATPVRLMVRERAGSAGEMELVAEAVELSAAEPREESAEGATTGGPAKVSPERSGSVYALPSGVSVREFVPGSHEEIAGREHTSVPSVAAHSAPSGASADRASGAASETSIRDGVVLAVFLPDGEAVRPGPRYLVDRAGRVLELVVEPMSGRVTVRPVNRAGATATEGER